MLKKILFILLYFFISLMLGNVLITILSFFNILSNNIINIIIFIYPLLLVIIYSFLLGKSAPKNGLIEGLKFGGIISIMFLLISFITNNFSPKIFIYYIIIISSASLSSMFGINYKEKNV